MTAFPITSHREDFYSYAEVFILSTVRWMLVMKPFEISSKYIKLRRGASCESPARTDCY